MKKRPIAQFGQRFPDAAAGAEQQSALIGNDNARQGPARKVLRHLVGEVMHVDDGFFDAGVGETIEHMVNERFARDPHQRLRHRVGQRAHACAESGGQHHGATRRVF